MHKHPSILRRALLAAGAALAVSGALAQAYPDTPIRLVVGYSAGGAVDIIARTVGQSLATSMGQPIVVENRPGAGTNIAVKSVISAPPDGYTLMLAANALAANMALYQPAPFDAERDLALIGQVGRVPVVIAANPSVPYNDIAQLIAAARAQPRGIAFASPGNGATPHMAVELFAKAAGIALQHVPYRGGAQAITDTIGGQVPLVAVNALEALPHVKSGKLKVLAALSAARTGIFPDVPTIAESGLPGFDASSWFAIFAPAKTPPEIVAKLNAEVLKALADPELQKRFADIGGEIRPYKPDELGAFVKAEIEKWAKVVKAANMKAD